MTPERVQGPGGLSAKGEGSEWELFGVCDVDSEKRRKVMGMVRRGEEGDGTQTGRQSFI